MYYYFIFNVHRTHAYGHAQPGQFLLRDLLDPHSPTRTRLQHPARRKARDHLGQVRVVGQQVVHRLRACTTVNEGVHLGHTRRHPLHAHLWRRTPVGTTSWYLPDPLVSSHLYRTPVDGSRSRSTPRLDFEWPDPLGLEGGRERVQYSVPVQCSGSEAAAPLPRPRSAPRCLLRPPRCLLRPPRCLLRPPRCLLRLPRCFSRTPATSRSHATTASLRRGCLAQFAAPRSHAQGLPAEGTRSCQKVGRVRSHRRTASVSERPFPLRGMAGLRRNFRARRAVERNATERPSRSPSLRFPQAFTQMPTHLRRLCRGGGRRSARQTTPRLLHTPPHRGVGCGRPGAAADAGRHRPAVATPPPFQPPERAPCPPFFSQTNI
eukprot:1184054-Prorocentrum_minimum.AAC.4